MLTKTPRFARKVTIPPVPLQEREVREGLDELGRKSMEKASEDEQMPDFDEEKYREWIEKDDDEEEEYRELIDWQEKKAMDLDFEKWLLKKKEEEKKEEEEEEKKKMEEEKYRICKWSEEEEKKMMGEMKK